MWLLVYKIAFILTAFGAGAIAIDIFVKKGERRTKFDTLFGLMSIAFVGWAAGRFALLVVSDHGQALSLAHLIYDASILVHVFFLHTILIFLGVERKLRHKLLLFFFYILGAFLLFVNNLYLFSGTHMFIADVVPKLGFLFYEVPGRWHHLHLLNYLVIPLYALILMLVAYIRANKGEKRSQLRWVMLAAFVGFLGGNSVLPLVYDIPIPPYLIVLVPFYLPILVYAITRYHLFNIKVLTTELFSLALWMFILVRIYVAADGTEQIANIILLILSIIVGVFLICSVKHEVEQRERIEALAKELESANERLKKLDQLKSEFVSLATHQIRGPVAAIKGYASLILEGDFGSVPEKVREPVETIFQSSSALACIVQDFLDISRIEQGKMKYDIADVDMSKLVSDVATELRGVVQLKHLTFTLGVAPGIIVSADASKLRQIVENLIDNSMKYTPRGGITVSLGEQGEKAVLRISDTGVGIKPEILPMLFRKFSRANDANKANLLGTGLGLYVAKQFISDQGGDIRAESQGEGKGSIFTVELPLKANRS